MKVLSSFEGDSVITEDSDLARTFYDKSHFGSILKGKVQLSILEALFLVDKEKLAVICGKKELSFFELMKKCKKSDKSLSIKYAVFNDLRSRGYTVKTALKYGADFRVYERGVRPGQDHAKWIVYPVHESHSLTWRDFCAKNRIAHSTKKHLLIALVDDESDVTYFEVGWIRP
ncbi:tRNA-intron lyase [Candidatus Woesearchaeota archaeon]|nr:tRNA-intron lyase [Candidatus Woesearchaeota archaeon]